MKDYGIDVFAQCIGGKVVFVRKPLVFKDDKKPFVSREKVARITIGLNCDKSYLTPVIRIKECRKSANSAV